MLSTAGSSRCPAAHGPFPVSHSTQGIAVSLTPSVQWCWPLLPSSPAAGGPDGGRVLRIQCGGQADGHPGLGRPVQLRGQQRRGRLWHLPHGVCHLCRHLIPGRLLPARGGQRGGRCAALLLQKLAASGWSLCMSRGCAAQTVGREAFLVPHAACRAVQGGGWGGWAPACRGPSGCRSLSLLKLRQ